MRVDRIEYRSIVKYLFLEGLQSKEVYRDNKKLGRSISMSAPENIDAVHELLPTSKSLNSIKDFI